MMRLSNLLIFSCFASASGFDFQSILDLFFPFNHLIDEQDARVVIHGLFDDISEADAKIISDSAISSFNDVYASTGYALQTFRIRTAGRILRFGTDKVGQTEDHSCYFCPPDHNIAGPVSTLIVANVRQMVGPSCKGCPEELDSNSSVEGHDVANKHSDFEKSFCEMLRNSDSPNLGNAKACTFDFLESSGGAHDFTNEAQILLKGTIHDISPADAGIFEKSVETAFNEVFQKVDLLLGRIEAVADIDVVVPRRIGGHGFGSLPPENYMKTSNEILVLARLSQTDGEDGCKFCLSERTDTSVGIDKSDIALMESEFENILCHKLSTSGSANFGNVESCSFRFVVKRAKKEEHA